MILCTLLRERGHDARVTTGAYRLADGRLIPHVHVRLGEHRLDPTREQFEPGPLVSDTADPRYQDEPWRTYQPPARPTRPQAQRFLTWQTGGHGYLRDVLDRVCAALGAPGLADQPASAVA